MTKRMKIMIIGLAIVFGGIIAFHLIKGFMIKRFFATYEPPPVTVSSVKAVKKDWHPHLNAVGNFVAVNGVDVNAQTSGNVVKIHFDSGQYVEQGMPLIDIDDSIDQALLKFNQADMALKEISYKRQADLFKRNATPSSSVDEARASLQQAQANVEKIQAQIQQKHIVAPFSGQLGIRQVDLGQYISPGQTSVVTLQSLDPLYLQFNLPEQMLKLIHIGQKVQFEIEEFPKATFLGKISAINSKVDPNTHNVLVQATLPNCPAEAVANPEKSTLISIKKEEDQDFPLVTCDTEINKKNHISRFVFIPGMFTSIAVEQPPVPNTIVLPSTAISYSLYGNSVFVIEPRADGKKDASGKEIYQVKRVFVTTGEQEGNDTIIKSGIKEGQLVVGSGELKLQNGASVVINNSVELNKKYDSNQLDQ